MVAAAAAIMIMTILSYAFQAGTNAMRQIRAQGDMSEHLRAVSNTLRRDLAANHHLQSEGTLGVSYRGQKVSNYDFSSGAAPTTGFFAIDCPPGTYEGNDQSFDAYRNAPSATYPTGCRIWFTSVLSGGADADLYTANVGGTVPLSSEAAEVAYFLVQTGVTSGNPPLPVFNLHRRQKLIAMDGAKQVQFSAFLPANGAVISQIAANPTQANTMTTIAQPGGRSPGIFAPLGNGDDIVLSNVLSLEFKLTWQHPIPARNPLSFAAPGNNVDYPYDSLTTATGSASAFSFDSLAPMPVRINGMQTRIRIWDSKVKTSRQITIIGDM
jgi:hypothetical protein